MKVREWSRRWLPMIARLLLVLVLAAILLMLFMTLAAYWAKDRQLFLAGVNVIIGLGVGLSLVYFAWGQLVHARTMRMLNMAPVLSPWFVNDQKLSARNAGKGPAMDVAACVCRLGVTADEDPKIRWLAEAERSHVAPGEDVGISVKEHQGEHHPEYPRAGPSGAGQVDVYILHYADLNGEHWHAWCNWNRDDSPDLACRHIFIVEPQNRTPKWIRRNCTRCRDLDRNKRAEAARTR